jgi:hypothetical protein
MYNVSPDDSLYVTTPLPFYRMHAILLSKEINKKEVPIFSTEFIQLSTFHKKFSRVFVIKSLFF